MFQSGANAFIGIKTLITSWILRRSIGLVLNAYVLVLFSVIKVQVIRIHLGYFAVLVFLVLVSKDRFKFGNIPVGGLALLLKVDIEKE